MRIGGCSDIRPTAKPASIDSASAVTRGYGSFGPLRLASLALSGGIYLCVCCGCGDGVSPQDAAQADSYAEAVRKSGGRVEIHLDFSHSEMTDDGLATLELPDAVRSIDLSYTDISDAGVAHLVRARNVQKLDLMSTKITDASVEHFRKLESLFQVSTENTEITTEAQLEMIRFFAPRQQAHFERLSTGQHD